LTLAAVAVFGAVLTSLLVATACSSRQSGPPRATIVDQLSLTSPNPAFVREAASTLEEAGYAVDYYSGEEVTVDFYRKLPKRDYRLVILRVHSGLLESLGAKPGAPQALVERAVRALADNVFLFTSEPYSETRHLEEQRALRLISVHYLDDGPENSKYFGIASDFVASSMEGRFEDTVVVLMGCYGLTFDRTAAAFVQRGAESVIGWDGLVSSPHTDEATERLLHYLLVEDVTPSEAVARAMADVGPDPSYGSKLALYPAEKAASSAP
jgi:hypothetical protein